MTSIRRITDRQDGVPALRLLKAIAVAHSYNQRAQALSFGVSIALAVAGLLTGPGSKYGTAVALGGTLWAAIYKIVMARWAERYLGIAATLQEMFDADVLGLPWNRVAVGDRIGEEEVSRLSRRFRGDEDRLRGYYLVASAAAPYDLLFCLEQNLAWGSRIRLRFAQMMLGILVLWSAAGILFTVTTGAKVSQLVIGWFVPSLGLLLLCLEMYRVQMASTRERLRVLGLVRAVIDDPSSPVIASPAVLTLFARQVQDTLYHMRRLQPRLPAWYFRRYHDEDRSDFQVKMREFEGRFPRS
ncbi:S-4TM family putative pore-forming effector [Actinophytocola sp.]|uniref:S-4TM family putative pore-forming effector n=1 Tax=Actinophytocola sp. TaxID=1872138 RepID=UPI002D7F3D13|nr:S-4TM family putative pore-forming effector [Actinophytocola sp.]HET9138886.1 S-4TM family putative pore-forming effector [Actinophytocola sp.]